MVDNKFLTDFSKNQLREISYLEMVNLYDSNCSDCPFKKLEVEVRKKRYPFDKLFDAIDFFCSLTNSASAVIHRGCGYSDNYLTLKEITSNTCRFWRATTCEGGDNELTPNFIEVNEQDEWDYSFLLTNARAL